MPGGAFTALRQNNVIGTEHILVIHCNAYSKMTPTFDLMTSHIAG